MPLSLGKHRWLRLLAAAIVLYLLFIPLWLFGLGAISWLAGGMADLIYHLLDPLVSISPSGRLINVSVTASEQSGFGGQVYSSALRMDTVTYGLPMIAALVLATRADSLTAKARALAIGMLIMAMMSVPAVMMWAKLASLQFEDRIAQANSIGSGDRSSFFYYTFHGYSYSQPVIAVAVWLALMMLGLFKGKRKEREPARTVARNAPCPCGSGRKYKRCCGRE